MSDTFLTRLMHFALQTTGAERGMAVNADGEVLDRHQLSEEEVNDPKFTGFRNIEQAYEQGEAPHITNNMILEPDMAPNTNTNFANLRLVIIFPFENVGSVYIDQPVRQGVINQEVIGRIQSLADHWLASGETALPVDEMVSRYQA